MTPERFELIKRKLALRQPDLTVLLDGVHKTHNFSAILRSCDAVGVYRAHAIPPEGGLPLASHIAQGAQKWVYVTRHPELETAHQSLRDQGFSLYAAHVGDQAVDYRNADLTQPCAIVLGTERLGISDSALALCDQVITIPMQGMVESLNVSVACALILFEAQRQRMAAGMYDDSRLPEEDYRRSLFEWAHPRIARYCREKGLDYPELDDQGDLTNSLRGMPSDPWTDQPD
jgi:tRNA (guanosine-2'-O-)-methyltransferase